MPVSQYPEMATATPTPMHLALDQVQETRWARISVYPRDAPAQMRYIPVRNDHAGQIHQEPLMHNVWSCLTSCLKMQVVRVKYTWQESWDFYEIKFAIPIIPGFGRSNAALLRLPECPAFVGEVAVVRRAGHRLKDIVDMRIEDRMKVNIAVTSVIRTAMGIDSRYRGNVIVQYMTSLQALDNLQ